MINNVLLCNCSNKILPESLLHILKKRLTLSCSIITAIRICYDDGLTAVLSTVFTLAPQKGLIQ